MLSSCSVTAPIVPKKALMTDDAIKIMEFAAQSLDAGHEVALATLVDIRGGSAHPLGSHMAIRDDGFYCGCVSGGCTEAAVASEAMEAISRGCDRNLLLGKDRRFSISSFPAVAALRLQSMSFVRAWPYGPFSPGLESG